MSTTSPLSPASPSSASTDIRARLALSVTPELYDAIRRLWIKHSKAEDARDLQGLIDTLTEGCAYEIVGTGQRWTGHAGARESVQFRVRVHWSTGYPGWNAQQAGHVSGTFGNMPQAPSVVGGRYAVTNLNAQGSQFFRLEK